MIMANPGLVCEFILERESVLLFFCCFGVFWILGALKMLQRFITYTDFMTVIGPNHGFNMC